MKSALVSGSESKRAEAESKAGVPMVPGVKTSIPSAFFKPPSPREPIVELLGHSFSIGASEEKDQGFFAGLAQCLESRQFKIPVTPIPMTPVEEKFGSPNMTFIDPKFNTVKEIDHYSQEESGEESDREEVDSENPDPYLEPPPFRKKDVLSWIRGDWSSEDDLGPVDSNRIRDRTNPEDLKEIIEELLSGYANEGYNSDSYIVTLVELLESYEYSLDEDVLERCLERAVKENNKSAARCFINKRASIYSSIRIAIAADSVKMLNLLEAECDEEDVLLAAKGGHLEALDYYFDQDFATTAEIILTSAAQTSDPKLVRMVCEKSDITQAYDLIKYLVKAGGGAFIPIFLENFKDELKKLLNELFEQDEGNGIFAVILHHAKNYVSQTWVSRIEMHRLLTTFDEQLTLSESLLVYPHERFNGSAKLRELRYFLDKDFGLNDESRLASSFIGTPHNPYNSYLMHSPQHRFPREMAERYFRSDKHPLSKKSIAGNSVHFEPHHSLPEFKAKKGLGREAHLGLYRSPLASLNKSKEIKMPQKAGKQLPTIGTGHFYDALLHNKHETCRYIINNLEFKEAHAVKIGFYHNYPCLMFYIETPSTVKKITNGTLKKWTEVVISYFVGLVNSLAQQSGLDIELIRQSSFGSPVPSIAACDQSFRLNVGVIPKDYADVITKSSKILNNVLARLNSDFDDSKQLNVSLPTNCFITSKEYKKYLTEKSNRTAPSVTNVFDLIWAKVDSKGYSGAYNLTRSSFARDGFSAEVYRLINTSNPQSTDDYTNILLNGLRWGFGKLKVIKNILTFDQTGEFKYEPVLKTHAPIKDTRFFEFISSLLTAITQEQQSMPLFGLIKNYEEEIRKVIDECVLNRSIQNFYYSLIMLCELLYARAVYTSSSITEVAEDGHGSDSDVEDGNEETLQYTYGKKIILSNGMRAILNAIHAGANHLFDNYLDSPQKHPLFLHGSYYETPAAMQLLARFETITNVSELSKTQILLCDVNPCIKDSKSLADIRNKLAHIKVLIIDSTSASTEEYHRWLKEFQKYPNMQILFFVSSGLKNEQLGDKNPYGTIRIFTKNKLLLENLMQFIKSKNEPLDSVVSHFFRRLMKKMGFTPSNKSIVEFKEVPKSKFDFVKYLRDLCLNKSDKERLKIICKQLGIRLHIIELDESQGKLIDRHMLISEKQIDNWVDAREIDLQDPMIFHLAYYQKSWHPLFPYPDLARTNSPGMAALISKQRRTSTSCADKSASGCLAASIGLQRQREGLQTSMQTPVTSQTAVSKSDNPSATELRLSELINDGP